MPRTAKEILFEAEQHLRVAKFGLSDMRGKPERRHAGLYNAIVFGRSATFALQNLRSVVDGFDEWYEPKQQEMKSDVLMTYFNETRRQIEHAAKGPAIRFGARIHLPDTEFIKQSRPPNAVHFFIGDMNGGSGWVVKNADGTTEKFYVDLPETVAKVEIKLRDAPGEQADKPAADVVSEYLTKIEALIGEAKARFQ